MSDLSEGVPPRVWAIAQRRIHPVCLAAGTACPACEEAIMLAFEEVYGGAETMDEVIGMIAYDLARGMAS